MTRRMATITAALLGAALLAAAPAAAAPTKEVVVLTSFPKELFEAYKQAFEQKFPGVKMIVKQQTNQGVTYLRETRARPEADVFWVSAVDAFQTLKADGLLDKVSLPRDLLFADGDRVGHGRQGQLRQGPGAGRVGPRPHAVGGSSCPE